MLPLSHTDLNYTFLAALCLSDMVHSLSCNAPAFCYLRLGTIFVVFFTFLTLSLECQIVLVMMSDESVAVFGVALSTKGPKN